MRYRLRFLLQEFDLPRGATIVGRSPDCNLTIDDPLVSREHARITIDDDGVRVEDMKSRNGVRVNGRAVREPTSLRDGDRIRIGSQDLVFCRVGSGRGHSRTTGELRLCANCGLPQARDVGGCPHCDATEQTDDVTPGDRSEQHRDAWNVQLLVETLERVLTLGRLSDAERIVARATGQVDEMVLSGRAIDTSALDAVAGKVVAMTIAANDPTWTGWVLDLYRRTGSIPSLEVTDRLAEVAARYPAAIGAALGCLVDHLQGTLTPTSEDESEALTRLQRARGIVEVLLEDSPGLDNNVCGCSETTEDLPGLT